MAEQEFMMSQAARMLGITPDAIKHYEKLGVVSFRRIGRNRIVTLADIERIKLHRAAHPPGHPWTRRLQPVTA